MITGHLRHCRRGTVMVEFLIVFMPLFILFLCILQLAFLYTTSLGVRHAATVGSRAAIVVFPDDPIRYQGAPANVIGGETGCSEGALARLLSSLQKLGLLAGELSPDTPCHDGPRVATVRRAVLMAMLPFGPRLSDVTGTDAGSLGGSGDWLLGSVAYNLIATAVTFPAEPGSRRLHPLGHELAADEPVTVRVTHAAYCGIPLARLLMCDSFAEIAAGRASFGSRDWVEYRRAQKRVEGGPGIADLRVGTAKRDSIYLLLGAPARFRILQAESTLPLMSAAYSYRTAEEREKGLAAGEKQKK